MIHEPTLKLYSVLRKHVSHVPLCFLTQTPLDVAPPRKGKILPGVTRTTCLQTTHIPIIQYIIIVIRARYKNVILCKEETDTATLLSGSLGLSYVRDFTNAQNTQLYAFSSVNPFKFVVFVNQWLGDAGGSQEYDISRFHSDEFSYSHCKFRLTKILCLRSSISVTLER
jgi:hypothetical protein